MDDHRLVELRVLQNLADGSWGDGVCFDEGAGQTRELKINPDLCADLVLTLMEDGFLNLVTSRDDVQRAIRAYMEDRRNIRRVDLQRLIAATPIYQAASVTYRGLRHIAELRDQLRRDRILDRFGILLDGRYITSDLIRLLEDGVSLSVILAGCG